MSPEREPADDRRFTLATDLDGTFLGGKAEDRTRLYRWIEENRDSVRLIFVTGRDPEFIGRTCAEGTLPWPEYVIGDVGTTIARVAPDRSIAPIEALEHEIAARWNDSGPQVRERLGNVSGLNVQQTPFRYRVSYHYDPELFDPVAHDIVAELGLDVLISDDRFLDVLPPGVSKGPSLLRLLAHLGVPRGCTLAAGDTLNDLSMLVAGTYAVAVGGSEAPLLQALPSRPEILRARGLGAAGIAEAIAHFNLHTESGEILSDAV